MNILYWLELCAKVISIKLPPSFWEGGAHWRIMERFTFLSYFYCELNAQYVFVVIISLHCCVWMFVILGFVHNIIWITHMHQLVLLLCSWQLSQKWKWISAFNGLLLRKILIDSIGIFRIEYRGYQFSFNFPQ